jgi:transposase-like protein
MKKKQSFDATTKISVLKRHLQKKEPISSLCEEHGFTPGSVYQWQETLFNRGHIVFENKTGRPTIEKNRDQEIEELKKKLSVKNAVISELTEELIREKKLFGVT